MPDSRMFSLPIVIRFDVLKDSMYSDASSGVAFAVNELDFQRVEKALHRRSSSPAEPPRQALTEPYVSLSTHTALVIQP